MKRLLILCSLFLAHLGIGIVFTLACVSREAGVKFFRFNAGLAAILIAVAFAFRSAATGCAASLGRVALIALVVAEAAVVLYWATVGRALGVASARRSSASACVGGHRGAGRAGARRQPRRARPSTQGLTVASFLSSSALLGGACTAMILGHWYLVIPSMEVSHLQSIVKLHIASMVVRIAVVARP